MFKKKKEIASPSPSHTASITAGFHPPPAALKGVFDPFPAVPPGGFQSEVPAQTSTSGPAFSARRSHHTEQTGLTGCNRRTTLEGVMD